MEKPSEASRYPRLVGEDPVEVGLLDLNQRALLGGTKTLRGRTLLVTGFITSDGAADGGFYVNRPFVTCCAADASPVRAKVTGAPGTYRKGSWVRITARYSGNEPPTDTNLEGLQRLRALTVKRIPVPDEPYAN